MATGLRKSGISVLGDVRWGSHFCHFYETKHDLLDTLVPYFKAGLESNEFCLWVVSNSELVTMAEAKEALAQAVPDLERHLTEENIEIVNGLDWYLEKDVFNLKRVTTAWNLKLKRALARGYDGLRVSGDTFWLEKKDWQDFRAYEKQLNDFTGDQPVTLLCTYPLARSRAVEILDVMESHHFALARRQGEWEVIQSPEPIEARAEIRRLNEQLQRVSDRTPERPAILRYGVAVLSVIAALVIGLLMRIEVGQQSTPAVALLLSAIILSVWFGGVRPGLLAISFALLAFMYYFAAPLHTLAVDIKEVPRLVIFVLSGLLVGLLTAGQRSKAESLKRARDLLDGTVQDLKRTNVALQTENAERKQAEEQLKATSELLRALSARLSAAREEEGTRIAREIHDELGSALSTLKWDLETFATILPDIDNLPQLASLQERIKPMTELIEATIRSVRRISSELRPTALDDLGLVAAIEWQARQFEERTGIICQCESSLERIDLAEAQATALFRIFQEALTNILRHAQATCVETTIAKETDGIMLTISDNGRGITEDEASGKLSLGLLGMRERVYLIGGEIDIAGIEGKGTTITVRVPLSDERR